jgi:hypothetical protein
MELAHLLNRARYSQTIINSIPDLVLSLPDHANRIPAAHVYTLINQHHLQNRFGQQLKGFGRILENLLLQSQLCIALLRIFQNRAKKTTTSFFASCNILSYNALAIMTLFFALESSAQVTTCPSLASIPVGRELSYKTFDDRNRLTQTQNLIVASNRIEAGYQTVYMDEDLLDARGRLIAKGEFVIRCQNDVLFFDMTRMIPSEALRGAETMEIRSDQSLLRLPVELMPGQLLPQGSTSVEVGPEASGSLMTLDFSIGNRRVESEVEIETPAGAFPATLIHQRSTARSKVLLLRKTWEYDEKVWYDLSMGLMIRTELYDLKGKLKTYTVLSRLE